MNRNKLENILNNLKYENEMAGQHMTVVNSVDWLVDILEAILEEKD